MQMPECEHRRVGMELVESQNRTHQSFSFVRKMRVFPCTRCESQKKRERVRVMVGGGGGDIGAAAGCCCWSTH